ncbi:MAG TPA: exosortase H-associated membrane protein [Usitatibacter sp.]|nr:exosortase H-associated membrane protein [Usitatibacter sp.]
MAEDPSADRGAVAAAIVPAPRHIARFVLATLAWSFVSFPLWFVASPAISAATGWIAARALEAVGPVDGARTRLHENRVVFEVQPDASLRYRERLSAAMTFEIEVDPRKQTVGLAFLAALVAAARPSRWWRLFAGCGALLVLAGIGVACEAALGFSTVVTPAGAPLFRPGGAAASALALGYQLGTLLVPTLAPIAFWLWARAGAAPEKTPPRRNPPIDA